MMSVTLQNQTSKKKKDWNSESVASRCITTAFLGVNIPNLVCIIYFLESSSFIVSKQVNPSPTLPAEFLISGI